MFHRLSSVHPVSYDVAVRANPSFDRLYTNLIFQRHACMHDLSHFVLSTPQTCLESIMIHGRNWRRNTRGIPRSPIKEFQDADHIVSFLQRFFFRPFPSSTTIHKCSL